MRYLDVFLSYDTPWILLTPPYTVHPLLYWVGILLFLSRSKLRCIVGEDSQFNPLERWDQHHHAIKYTAGRTRKWCEETKGRVPMS